MYEIISITIIQYITKIYLKRRKKNGKSGNRSNKLYKNF